MNQNRSVLITGGAGYIGSHITLLLRQEGYRTIVYDNLSTGNAALIPESDLVVGDILDTAALTDIMKRGQIETVIHLAAKSSVPESFEQPDSYFTTNVEGTKSVIAACAKAHVKQLLFSSTAAVYGNATHGLVTEMAPLNPISPYGSSKLEAEKVIAKLSPLHGIKYITFRYFNVIGAHPGGLLGQNNPKSGHLLQCCFNCIRNSVPVEVYGDDFDTADGSAERDYIHVQDLASLHLHAMQYLQNDHPSLLVNAGYGSSYSVLEFIKTVREVTGMKLMHTTAPRRDGDPSSLIADVSLLNQKLDWTPKHHSLEQMIGDSWAWENSKAKALLS